MSEKTDEGNKAVKGVKEGVEQDAVGTGRAEKRQDMREWKRETWRKSGKKK
jgi:hypothetical protein